MLLRVLVEETDEELAAAILVMTFRAVSLTPPFMGVSRRRSEKATVCNGFRTPPRISAPRPKPLKTVLNSFATPLTPMNGGVNERLRPKRGMAPAQVVLVRIAELAVVTLYKTSKFGKHEGGL